MRKDETKKVLLIDNFGLSHYTSYFALGLSKYRNVLLYGLSRSDYILTGASKTDKISFFDLSLRLYKSNSSFKVIVNHLLVFCILFKALIRNKYEILHVQAYLPFFLFFLPILHSKAKHVCVTVHDVDLRPSKPGLYGIMEILYSRIIAQRKLLLQYADSIIVHGNKEKEKLLSLGINGKKIHVVPHPDYLYLRNNNCCLKDYDSSYILFFGKIKPYKGIDIFIKSFKILKDILPVKFKIIIAGKGDTSYFNSLLTQEDLKYITIRNEFISEEEIPSLFLKSKFIVLPYKEASQSGVIPLAYTFCRPVIISNVGSLTDYVDDGITGYVFESGDYTKLAKIISELFLDEKRCIEMGMAGYRKMLEEMSIDKICKVINYIYNN